MIWRAGCRAEALHFLNEEGQQGAFVLDGSLGHGVEIGLVGRATALCHHHEPVLRTLRGFDINLRRQVATGVDFVIHGQRSVLRVAQVVLGEGVVDTARESLFVFEAGPHLLSLLAVDDGCARVLAERKHSLAGCLGIAEELQGHVLVVVAGLRVVQDSCHVLTAKHELHVVESLLSQQCERLGTHFHNFLAFKLCNRNTFGAQQAVLCGVFSQLKHRSILEFWFVCHNNI